MKLNYLALKPIPDYFLPNSKGLKSLSIIVSEKNDYKPTESLHYKYR